jgi:competence protein ComEA
MLFENPETGSIARRLRPVCMDPSLAGGGGREAAASATPHPAMNPARKSAKLWLLFQRVRQSVWAEVTIKAGLIGLGLAALAALGVASTWASPAGVPVLESALASSLPAHISDGGAPRASPPPAQQPTGDAGAPRDKIILNLASAEDLTRLPGVGPKRAQAIVELRARLHGFKRTADLLRVRGIGPRGLKRMLPYLALDAPSAPTPELAPVDGGK